MSIEKIKGLIRIIKLYIKSSVAVIDNNHDGSYDIHLLVDGDEWNKKKREKQ